LERSVDEVFVRREVIDAAKLRSLCEPSNAQGAIQTLSHVGAIAATGTLLWLCIESVWVVPLFAIHGILLNFLYAGQHELSHWTVFRTGWLNEWVGRVFGFVLFYPLYPELGARR
jgi:fatty acid desaturase